jgi:hypothetical protein
MALAVALLVSACGTAQDTPSLITTSSGVDAIVHTSSLRSVLVHTDPKGRVRYCAEPAPDVALDTIREITAALKAKADVLGGVSKPELDANATYKLTATARELAGRSMSVVLARDLLFRLCELSINFADEESSKFESIASRYDKVVDKIVTILAVADLRNAETSVIEAQVEAARILGTQESQIDAIVAAVGGDKLDSSKLSSLVDKAKLGANAKKEVKGATSIDDLRDRLRGAGAAVVSPIFNAIQKS